MFAFKGHICYLWSAVLCTGHCFSLYLSVFIHL